MDLAIDPLRTQTDVDFPITYIARVNRAALLCEVMLQVKFL